MRHGNLPSLSEDLREEEAREGRGKRKKRRGVRVFRAPRQLFGFPVLAMTNIDDKYKLNSIPAAQSINEDDLAQMIQLLADRHLV